MSFPFNPSLTEPIDLFEQGSWPASRHKFTPESKWAINAALAAKRPLLLRGEPGIGKSQLARAAAKVLGVPFLSHVVNERSERDDLLYSYDAVARLALAQMGRAAFNDPAELRACLEETNFIAPGVLWWAYAWEQAAEWAKKFSDHCRPCAVPVAGDWTPTAPSTKSGPVILIDEIDKADPSVPNGLLESLGNEGFSIPQLAEPVRLPEGAKPPLVIITTNEERELPSAFLRRCLVLQMPFPDENDAPAVEKFLIEDRARVFWKDSEVSDAVCKLAVSQLLKDRQNAREQGFTPPGAAEFLDVVRILVTLHKGGEEKQRAALEHVGRFAFQKHLIDAR